MIFEQVHLIDIQKATVGASQQARFESLDALRQGALQIQGADHPIFGGSQRQINNRHWYEVAAQRPARPTAQTRAALAAAAVLGRITGIAAAHHGPHFG